MAKQGEVGLELPPFIARISITFLIAIFIRLHFFVSLKIVNEIHYLVFIFTFLPLPPVCYTFASTTTLTRTVFKWGMFYKWMVWQGNCPILVIWRRPYEGSSRLPEHTHSLELFPSFTHLMVLPILVVCLGKDLPSRYQVPNVDLSLSSIEILNRRCIIFALVVRVPDEQSRSPPLPSLSFLGVLALQYILQPIQNDVQATNTHRWEHTGGTHDLWSFCRTCFIYLWVISQFLLSWQTVFPFLTFFSWSPELCFVFH